MAQCWCSTIQYLDLSCTQLQFFTHRFNNYEAVFHAIGQANKYYITKWRNGELTRVDWTCISTDTTRDSFIPSAMRMVCGRWKAACHIGFALESLTSRNFDAPPSKEQLSKIKCLQGVLCVVDVINYLQQVLPRGTSPLGSQMHKTEATWEQTWSILIKKTKRVTYTLWVWALIAENMPGMESTLGLFNLPQACWYQ